MQQLKSALRSNDPKFDDTARARTLAALAALISMFLPWVWLDGDNSALNGAELLAYAFTSPERRAMIQTSLLGSLGNPVHPADGCRPGGLRLPQDHRRRVPADHLRGGGGAARSDAGHGPVGDLQRPAGHRGSHAAGMGRGPDGGLPGRAVHPRPVEREIGTGTDWAFNFSMAASGRACRFNEFGPGESPGGLTGGLR